jgi:hypothetical protein
MAQGALQMADQAFWGKPLEERAQIESDLAAEEKDALVLDAPRKVAIDVRNSLPLVLVRVAHFALAAGVPIQKFGILVAADAEGGVVRAGRAIEPPDRRTREPEPGEGSGMAAEALLIDVRERLDLPWRRSQLAISLILREQISDEMRVALDLTPGAYRDEAVEKKRQKDLLDAPLPAISPAPSPTAPVPAYRKVEGAPEIPDKPGLALASERVVKLHSAGPLVVKGAYRVKVPPHLFVSGDRAEAVKLDPKPAALVPITLVITATVAPAPYTLNLVVPSWDADPKTGIAAGTFAIDLDKVGPLRRQEKTLFVYGFAFDQRFGPLPIGLAEE